MAKGEVVRPVKAERGKSESEYSESRRVVRVFLGRKLAVIGLVFIGILILTAIFAPLLAPYNPYKMDIPDKLAAPSGTIC